ncbi:MAG TPA: alpha/beta hydrolase [Leeuwenhoekiella sp.]|nr:alpha/beta hydrolase [Leeuwenhoekiella sp.]
MINEEKTPHIITGTGKKNIVFVHYFGGDARSWQWMAAHLKEDCTCYLLNLPGFGNTDPLEKKSIEGFAAYINQYITDLKLDHYVLCGHSMGAKIVAYAAANAPKKPEQLILIAPSPPTVEKMPPDEKKRMLKHPDHDEAVTTVKNATVQQLDHGRFQHAVDSQLAIDDETWDWWLEKGMDHDVSAHIKTGHVRTTIICSQDDPVISMQWIEEEVKPYFKNPTVITWKNLGHLIPMEAPEKLAKTLQKLLKTDQ